MKNITIFSPFSMAYGQLFGMRIPVTLAVKRKSHLLVLGVLLSSLAWDTVYISLGLIFGSVLTIKPVYMFPGFLGRLDYHSCGHFCGAAFDEPFQDSKSLCIRSTLSIMANQDDKKVKQQNFMKKCHFNLRFMLGSC